MTRDDSALDSDVEVIGMPAFASVNSGTMRKLVHGWSRCSIHSTTETDSRASIAVSGAVSQSTGRAAGPRPRTRAAERTCRCHQPEDHPGDRRVDARLEHREPQRDTDHDVGARADAQPAQRDHSDEDERDSAPSDIVGVEDGDHQDRADVVDDGERHRNSLTVGARGPEQGQYADRERGVGRHRECPTVRARPPCLLRRRSGPAAATRRLPRTPEAAVRRAQIADELAADLEPDDQEEDRHQAVVDPLLQVDSAGDPRS